jgi:hypothetical protein
MEEEWVELPAVLEASSITQEGIYSETEIRCWGHSHCHVKDCTTSVTIANTGHATPAGPRQSSRPRVPNVPRPTVQALCYSTVITSSTLHTVPGYTVIHNTAQGGAATVSSVPPHITCLQLRCLLPLPTARDQIV